MTKFIHELVFHVVVVMAGVMFCVGVLMVFWVRVLMMNWLCCFLWLWFRRLCSPPGPGSSADHPHVSCQNRGITAVLFTMCWFFTPSVKLGYTVRDNTTSYVCCVIPVSILCSTVQEHRATPSQMLNMADLNPSVTLILSVISPAPQPMLPLPRLSHPIFLSSLSLHVTGLNSGSLHYNINPKSQILKA